MIFENLFLLVVGFLFGFTLYWIAWTRGYNVGKEEFIKTSVDAWKRATQKDLEKLIKKDKEK